MSIKDKAKVPYPQLPVCQEDNGIKKPHWQPSPERTSLSSKRLPAGANLKIEGAASIGRNRENNASTQKEQQKAYVVCVRVCYVLLFHLTCETS